MMRNLLLLLIIIFATGCAPIPQVMVYSPRESGVGAHHVWPQPPEIPRYQYIGELVGEYNFKAAPGATVSRTEKFLRWVVGLGQRVHSPKQLIRPISGAVYNGRIYVTDQGGASLFVFDEAAAKLDIWTHVDAGGTFLSPIGVIVSQRGEILVTDSELARVVRFDVEGEALGSFGKGQLLRPTGITSDTETGLIYVADSGAHDIKVFTVDGTYQATIGKRGQGEAEFNGPTHLAFADGKLYVSDTLNARIQILEPNGDYHSGFGRRGLYTGELVRPKGVAVDEDIIYVIESYYDHLLMYDQEGNLLLPIGGAGDGIGKFFLPAGVWIDRARIFVADMFNSRVVVFEYLGD